MCAKRLLGKKGVDFARLVTCMILIIVGFVLFRNTNSNKVAFYAVNEAKTCNPQYRPREKGNSWRFFFLSLDYLRKLRIGEFRHG